MLAPACAVINQAANAAQTEAVVSHVDSNTTSSLALGDMIFPNIISLPLSEPLHCKCEKSEKREGTMGLYEGEPFCYLFITV